MNLEDPAPNDARLVRHAGRWTARETSMRIHFQVLLLARIVFSPILPLLAKAGSATEKDARRLVEGYVEHYNSVRLNSTIGYITPKDMLAGRRQEIHAERLHLCGAPAWCIQPQPRH